MLNRVAKPPGGDARAAHNSARRVRTKIQRGSKVRNLIAAILSSFGLVVAGCGTAPDAARIEPAASAAAETQPSQRADTIPTLREVGSRGFFDLDGPFAAFDPNHPSVEIWVPNGDARAPVVVYAHGGAGYREDDRTRVEMFRRNGFATISFDSYEMNGFSDWNFVTRRVANSGKQAMIWGVFTGAVEFAADSNRWDSRNIFLYGTSNGGRVVLHAGAELDNDNIRGVIAEAPAGSGFALGDYDVPTIIPFGALDTWAGQSDTDYVWRRTYPDSPVSIEAWVNAQRSRARPVRFIFYENAGHLMFDGPLERVTVPRGDAVSFSAYRGAADGVLQQYERDVIAFANENIAR